MHDYALEPLAAIAVMIAASFFVERALNAVEALRALVTIKRHGGLTFVRIGRFGFTYFIARPIPRHEVRHTLRDGITLEEKRASIR